MRKASTGFAFTAVVWLLVIGLGTMGSIYFYKPWILEEREQTKARMQNLETEFKEQWQVALDTCADTPSVESCVAKLQEHKRAHELIVPYLYHFKLAERLQRIDGDLKTKHTRIKLAYDSFSGYCVFRSKQFQDQLAAKDIRVHLVNDEGDEMYKNRIMKLKSGEVPLAVFTIDALINNSALFDDPPAAIVMVIDESRGADAMVASKEALPDLNALNRKDIKIVLTPDSPSETLARLVRFHFDLPDLPKECFVEAKDAMEVYELARAAKPGEPKAFVLWEPFVSQLLEEKKGMDKLITSADPKCQGYIMDVLVCQKEYLKNHKKEVEGIVQAYLQASYTYQHAQNGMVKLVQSDSENLAKAGKLPKGLTVGEAEKVVEGISWKKTSDNYALLGLDGSGKAGDLPPLEEMVKKITTVLVKTRAISRSTPPALVDRSICENLQKEHFDESKSSSVASPVPPPPDPNDWSKLPPLAKVKVEPLRFSSGKFALTTDHVEELEKEVVGLLKKKPCYLEIRGCATGKSEADQNMAQKRADAVYDKLKGSYSVDAKRMKKTTEIGADEGKVAFFFFEAPE